MKELKPGTEFMPSPMVIAATYNEDGSADAMAAAWCGVCSSNPPGVMVALRKGRRTLENIQREGGFVLHTLCREQMEQGDYFGLVSGAKADKIATVGYHTVKAQNVNAPVISEFPIAAECAVYRMEEMGEHMVILAEIMALRAEESTLNEKGGLDLRKAGVLLYDQTANDYYAAGPKEGDCFKVGIPYLKK